MTGTITAPSTVLSTTVIPQQQEQQQQEQAPPRTMNYRSSIFPRRLYEMLENADKYGYASMISWMPDGRSFRIDTDHYDKAEIVTLLTRCHFKQSKFKSFTKQLILYSFQRLKKNHYAHPLMIRGRPELFYKKSRREFSLDDMKETPTTTTSTTSSMTTTNTIAVPFPNKISSSSPNRISSSPTYTTTHQHAAYHAMLGRHLSTLPPSMEHVEQYLPSLPLYIPQQEQANFVDRLGDMYSKNDDITVVENDNANVSSSVVSYENNNNTDTESLNSSSNGNSIASFSSENDETYTATSAASLVDIHRLELLFNEESDYACTLDISTQEQERYHSYYNTNNSKMMEMETELLMLI